MILLLGANGSMGKRYQAIFKYWNHPCWSLDVGYTDHQLDEIVRKCDGVIIATPTETHYDLLKRLHIYAKPILCEKPITKDPVQLDEILKLYEGRRLSMMLQYYYAASMSSRGVSFYDFYYHGNDGIAWDCMQILGLANGPVVLSEESPSWRCVINGTSVSKDHMDAAYCNALADWMNGRDVSKEFLKYVHEKASAYEREIYSGRHRYPSSKHVDPFPKKSM